jgi:hypothetical protein
MIYEKRVSVGAFLKKGEDLKDGDIVEIANEGKPVEGQFGTQDVFLVKVGEKEGNISFNQTTINNLIDGYGKDSVQWIGKKVKVWAILSNVQGKMIKVYYFLHPDTVLDEASGEFVLGKKEDEPKEELEF